MTAVPPAAKRIPVRRSRTRYAGTSEFMGEEALITNTTAESPHATMKKVPASSAAYECHGTAPGRCAVSVIRISPGISPDSCAACFFSIYSK